MSGLPLFLAAAIAGWTSTDSWRRNYRAFSNETVVVTNVVRTHNGTIDIGAKGGLHFVRGSRYIASEGSCEPEIVNVGDGGRFALQGELWVYCLKFNVAPGGKALLDPTKAGFWSGTWQHSLVVNEGFLKLPHGLDFKPASNEGARFTIVQKSGRLVLGGDLRGKLNLRLEGGEVKVVGDAAILCDAVVTGEVKIDVAKGAGIDFRRVKVEKGGKVVPTGKGLFLTDAVRRHSDAPGAYAGIVSTVSFRDGKECHWQNPLCGAAPGYWVFLERGQRRVEDFSGNRTALWSLNRYSTGYHVAWDKGNEQFDKYTKPHVGPDNVPLDDTALASISNSFVRCRENGGSIVPRFAYNGWWAVGVEPPDVATITNHIRQLAGVIAPFRDVVPSVDCGIIGPWGEMHSSKYSDDEHKEARELIVKAWLKYLPKEFYVTLRSPRYLVDDPDRRLGFYNDGYLGTFGDTGTWNGKHDRKWACAFMKDRPYIPYGGEFAGVEEKYAKDNAIFRPKEWNIVREWYETHLAYLRNCGADNRATVCRYLLNLKYSKKDFWFAESPNLDEYEGEDLYRFCRDHMGSRYVVRRVAFAPGRMTLAVENTGFCAMPFKSVATLLFERDEKFPDPPVEVAVTGVSAPIESVLPGKTEKLRYTFAPPKLGKGRWHVYLRHDVPPKRSLRLMNADSWNRDLRANRLLTVEY